MNDKLKRSTFNHTDGDLARQTAGRAIYTNCCRETFDGGGRAPLG